VVQKSRAESARTNIENAQGRYQLRKFGKRDHMYFFYRWFSRAVHGSPVSFGECQQRPSQPEPNPTAALGAASACLADTCELAVLDLSVPLRAQARQPKQAVNALP
jgi:hypothetical protein